MTGTKSRRRGAELEAAILDAAWDELAEVGYGRLTIESVAARAGTSKPVIYRRWANRAELAVAAWNRRTPISRDVIDTGSLRSDLLVLFRRIAQRMEGMMSEMIAGVMSEAFKHPEVASLLSDRLAKPFPLTDSVEGMVRRAVERGELPPVQLSLRAARLPLDLLRNEGAVCGTPITDETLNELVDGIFLPLLRGLASADD